MKKNRQEIESLNRLSLVQIFNLPYRRFVIGRASVTPETLEFAHDPQVTNLRYSRLQVCATGVGDTVNRYEGEGQGEGELSGRSQSNVVYPMDSSVTRRAA